MHLVGVISKNKEMIKFLNNEVYEKKVEFIELNAKTIENFKNVKFDVILISNLKNVTEKSVFKKVILNSSISAINTDVKENLELLESVKGTVITYGFNPKATITVSSVNDENISICIQRGIYNIDGKKIEPIEYVEKIDNAKNIEIADIIGVKATKKILAEKKN